MSGEIARAFCHHLYSLPNHIPCQDGWLQDAFSHVSCQHALQVGVPIGSLPAQLYCLISGTRLRDYYNLVKHTINRLTQSKIGTTPDPDREATQALCCLRQNVHRSAQTHSTQLHLH